MATARVAAGSVLDTVTATANTISVAVNTVGDGIQMLGKFVAKHRHMQELSIIAELDSFEIRLAEDTALETQKRRIEIDKWISSNPDYKAEYESELARVKALLNHTENNNITELKAA